ncbi:MAG TPA: glycosyl transferase, partial [Bacteroidia bacterium]|nr:glycosyl transferase [Bacteroidia bacterium]
KSFAQYFYSNEQPWTNPQCTDLGWLLRGDIDKPAYFACKINSLEEWEKEYPEIKEMYRKNGFVFLERVPPKH